jgi:hypothetical protein
MKFISAEEARNLIPKIPESFIQDFNSKVAQAAKNKYTNIVIDMSGIPTIVRELILEEWKKEGFHYAAVGTYLVSVSWRQLS